MVRLSSREGLAIAAITGLAEAYASAHRLTWQQAMREIRDRVARYQIPTGRTTEVLSRVACRYLDAGNGYHAVALHLLLDAGADLDRARALRVEAARRRVLREWWELRRTRLFEPP